MTKPRATRLELFGPPENPQAQRELLDRIDAVERAMRRMRACLERCNHVASDAVLEAMYWAGIQALRAVRCADLEVARRLPEGR
jgi:hypothetical protein